jgi:Ala-tRNA(Pro) deacylase
MAISNSLKEHLRSRGIPYETVPHLHTVTSMQTAQAAHVSGEFVAKGVVLAEEDTYLLAVVPATHRLQFGWIQQHLGHHAGLATEAEVGRLFEDCEVGAVPACGEPFGLKMIVEEKLLELPAVCFESGDHEQLLRMSGEAFRELVEGAEVASISRHV